MGQAAVPQQSPSLPEIRLVDDMDSPQGAWRTLRRQDSRPRPRLWMGRPERFASFSASTIARFPARRAGNALRGFYARRRKARARSTSK